MDLFRKQYGNAHTLKYLSKHFVLETEQLKMLQKIYMQNIEIKETNIAEQVLHSLLKIIKENKLYRDAEVKHY